MTALRATQPAGVVSNIGGKSNLFGTPALPLLSRRFSYAVRTNFAHHMKHHWEVAVVIPISSALSKKIE
jgi:hypothetical protein